MQPIQVLTRIRPTTTSPSSLDVPSEIVRSSSSKTLLLLGKQQRTFQFERCFGPNSTNLDVFEALHQPVLQSVYWGQNASIMAYGQSNAGKTFTMFGSDSDEGVAQRIIRTLMTSKSQEDDVHFSVSYYEIYNEKVKDLLVNESSEELRVREHSARGPFVVGLSNWSLGSPEEAIDLLKRGNDKRVTGETNVNSSSSRSHAIFQIDVTVTKLNTKDGTCKLTSRLTLVDLAGSERQAKAQTQGTRLKEASTINTSLVTLGMVITALSTESPSAAAAASTAPITPNAKNAPSKTPGGGSMSASHIPYRNSLLTWLLRDSLGGNAKTFMIANVSSDARDYEETLSTLRYADRAKSVLNNVTVNEEPSSVLIRALRKELELLRRRLEKKKTIPTAAIPSSLEDVENDPSPIKPSLKNRKQHRFSIDALEALTEPVNLMEQVRTERARADQAEKDSKERAEVLWQTVESMRAHMLEAIAQAEEQKNAAIVKNEQEEIIPLVEEIAAFQIQSMWRKYKVKLMLSLIEKMHAENNQLREEAFVNVKAMEECQVAELRVATETNQKAKAERERKLAEEEKRTMEARLREYERTAASKMSADENVIKLAQKLKDLEAQLQIKSNGKAVADENAAKLAQKLKDLEAQLQIKSDGKVVTDENAAKLTQKLKDVEAQLQLKSNGKAVADENALKLAQKLKEFEAQMQNKSIGVVNTKVVLDENVAKLGQKIKELETQLQSKSSGNTRVELNRVSQTLKEMQERTASYRIEIERLEIENRKLGESVVKTKEEAEQKVKALALRANVLERAVESKTLETSRALEERMAKITELEKVNDYLRRAETESRQLRETETETLREQLKATEGNAVGDLERLNARLKERGDEESKRAHAEVRTMETKIQSLELSLQTNKAVTQKEIQERDRRRREIEKLNRELQKRVEEERERKNRELEAMDACVARLRRDLETNKVTTVREIEIRDRKVLELEKLISTMQSTQPSSGFINGGFNGCGGSSMLAGGSFLQYVASKPAYETKSNLSSQNGSVISVASGGAGNGNSANGSMSHSFQPSFQELLCVRVDVEAFDESSALFFPSDTTVSPADPTSRTFLVKSPLYDMKKSRWCRIVIKFVNGRVENLSEIALVHHLPKNQVLVHRLRIVKTEREPKNDNVISVACDWDLSSNMAQVAPHAGGGESFEDSSLSMDSSSRIGKRTTHRGHDHGSTEVAGGKQRPACFCFTSMDESGPMTLHARFQMDGAEIGWEYPMRFKHKSNANVEAVIEKIPGLGSKYRHSRRASDDVKHAYMNTSWFSFENDPGNVLATKAGPVQDSQRVISVSGYLSKAQSHAGGKVQRWFIFAPPFLFCYKDAKAAAMDFTKGRAMPHSANRALRVTATTKISILPPPADGADRVGFIVFGDSKKWTLQAANKQDMDRWTKTLHAWVLRKKTSFQLVKGGDNSVTMMEDQEDTRLEELEG